MAIDPEPPSLELAQLDLMIAHSRKRAARAALKLQIAHAEDGAARNAYEEARRARLDWLEKNPPAQGDLLT